MKNEKTKQIIRMIKNIVLVILIVIVVAVPSFIYFRLSTEGRLALREAKNVKLTIEMLDVNYYAKGKLIYAPELKDGLQRGVAKDVRSLLELDDTASFEIIAYDESDRAIKEMIYTNEHYIVKYEKKDNGNRWRVNYILPIISLGTDK